MRTAMGDSPAERALQNRDELRDYAGAVTALLGTGTHQRFLKVGDQFGQMDLLSVKWSSDTNDADGRLTLQQDPHWDVARFGSNCAGCHATGLEASTRQFKAMSLDCYVCHGDPSDDHTEHAALVWLSPQGFERSVGRLRELADEAGRPGPEPMLLAFAAIGDDESACARDAAQLYRGQYDLDYEQVHRWTLTGSVGRVAEQLAEYRSAGARSIAIIPARPDLCGQVERIAAVRQLLDA